jgi:hypothetical protein
MTGFEAIKGEKHRHTEIATVETKKLEKLNQYNELLAALKK